MNRFQEKLVTDVQIGKHTDAQTSMNSEDYPCWGPKNVHYHMFLESIAKTLATCDVSVRQPTFTNFGLFANKRAS